MIRIIILCALAAGAASLYNFAIGGLFSALELRDGALFTKYLIFSVSIVSTMALLSSTKDYITNKCAFELRKSFMHNNDDVLACVDSENFSHSGMKLTTEFVQQFIYLCVFLSVLSTLTASVLPIIIACMMLVAMLFYARCQVKANQHKIVAEATLRMCAIKGDERKDAIDSLEHANNFLLKAKLKTHFVDAFGGNVQYALCLCLLAPAYFWGQMELGALMQAVNAMQMVVLAILSVNRHVDDICLFIASKERLGLRLSHLFAKGMRSQRHAFF